MDVGSRKILIVNADDFGLSPGINRGILRAQEDGIVTSTSAMVRWPAAAELTSVVRSHPALGVGLHVDLGEWIYRDEEWAELYHVLSPEQAASPKIVQEEVMRQLSMFRSLTGRDPTHLDSHQHVHRSEPLRSILTALATELNVPLRHFDSAHRYCGNFYGQSGKGEPFHEGITVESLLQILETLSSGTTELCCHPGLDQDYSSQYQLERAIEVDVLCDPSVRSAIEKLGIELRTFTSHTANRSDKTPVELFCVLCSEMRVLGGLLHRPS